MSGTKLYALRYESREGKLKALNSFLFYSLSVVGLHSVRHGLRMEKECEKEDPRHKFVTEK